jgi:hypothetical protein
VKEVNGQQIYPPTNLSTVELKELQTCPKGSLKLSFKTDLLAASNSSKNRPVCVK